MRELCKIIDRLLISFRKEGLVQIVGFQYLSKKKVLCTYALIEHKDHIADPVLIWYHHWFLLRLNLFVNESTHIVDSSRFWDEEVNTEWYSAVKL